MHLTHKWSAPASKAIHGHVNKYRRCPSTTASNTNLPGPPRVRDRLPTLVCQEPFHHRLAGYGDWIISSNRYDWGLEIRDGRWGDKEGKRVEVFLICNFFLIVYFPSLMHCVVPL